MMVNLRQEFTPLSSVSFCSSAYNDCSEVSWDDMKLAGDNNTATPTTTTTNGSATTKAQQLLSHLSSASTQEIHQALIKYNQTKEHELRAVTAKLSKLQIEHDALKLLSLTSDLEASDDKQDHSASTAATTSATTTSSTAATQNATTTTTQQRFSLPRLNRSRSQRAIHNSFNSASGSMQLLIDTNGKLMAENYKLETSVNGLRRSLSSYIRLSKQCEVSDKETIHKLERENKELKMRLNNNNNNLNTKNEVEIVAANTALQQLGLSVNDIPHDVDNPFAGGGEKPEEDVVALALALDSPSSTVDERKKKKMATTNGGDDEMKKKMMTVSVKSLYIPHRSMRRTTSVTACLDDESDVTWEEEYGYDEEEDGIVLEARHAQSNEEGGGNDIAVDELLYNEMMAISASSSHYRNEEEDDDDGDVRKHSNALLVDFDGDRRSRRRESTNRVMQYVSCGDGRRWQSQIVLTS